jgi:hypothetical protein
MDYGDGGAHTLRSGNFQRLAIIGAICWTALLGFWFSSGVAYLFFISDTNSPAQQATAAHRAAQFAVNGAQRPFIGLAFPVILAAAPLFAHRSRRVLLLLMGTMLLVLSISGSDSGGVFYLPAATLLLLAAIPSRGGAPVTK